MTTADDETLYAAVAQFNAGAYFECHETLEGLWLRDETPQRVFYQGLIQVAAAFVHVGRGRHRGVVPLLDAGLAKLAGFPQGYRRLDLDSLRQEMMAVRDVVARQGAPGLSLLRQAERPTIRTCPALREA